MNLRWEWLAVLAALTTAATGCGDDASQDDGDGTDGAGATGAGPATGGEGVGGSATGGSGPVICEPGEQAPCYSGPAGTQDVGVCTAGVTTCLPDGTDWSACEGEVAPAAEVCATPGDDDCDGQANEDGDDCACTPGVAQSCYSGPPATQGVGTCQGGSQVCNAAGNGFEPCTGEVVPVAESCLSAGDEDCDGQPNEGCVCTPGAVESCYTGPAGTSGQGVCQPGSRTCNADGMGWGSCLGEVTPGNESCATGDDEDCDGQANEGCACTPGQTVACYTGPAGTSGVGICHGGTQQCNAQGTGYSACTGQVTPQSESCGTASDDDCDGQTNEGCACVPGSTTSCYSGPGGTAGVGICQAGSMQCNAQGTGYGACNGQVLPGVENCQTAADENCDGQTPACPVVNAIVDLRADVNRNGTVDLADPTEDANEASWSATAGAVFLANLDDDQLACPIANQSDAQLAACNDAADSVVNGTTDLQDLARLKTVPWPQAPGNAFATISVSAAAASKIRLFRKVGTTFQNFNWSVSQISAAELQAGVELAIEANDIVRNPAVWNGLVDITFTVNGGTGPNGPIPGGSDTVRMRVAPAVFRHHNHPADTVYVTKINNNAGSTAFRADLLSATSASGVPGGMVELTYSDQWTQDFFETAYMSMPKTGGTQHVIHINFRSANYTASGLRYAGRTVFTDLRGVDTAGAVQFDPSHANYMDTLNSFGNMETIPPMAGYPLGRILRGSTPSFYPDTSFDAMLQAQAVQPIVYVNTEWLLVAHVDETMSFIKANTPRGWALMANDATLAVSMLQAYQNAGYGNSTMFAGKYWSGGVSAQRTINQVLGDPDIMNESAWAAAFVDDQVDVIKATTGLTNAEIVPVPFLHWESSGYSVAYQPGTVNGIYLSNTDFAAPTPHGPVIGGVDIFEDQLEEALLPYGIDVHWVEDWDLYHRLLGEVHCGSNTKRQVPNSSKWWESGL